MSERIAELMAKGRAGRLTESEADELARLLNAPILDPVVKSRVGFDSKRTLAPSDIEGLAA
jgi:hypothetical protein